MYKSKVKIAGIHLLIETTTWYVHELCKKYLCKFDKPDIEIKVNNEMVLFENKGNMPSSQTEFAICESAAVLRYFNNKLIEFNAFVFHGASFRVNDKGIIFCAQSGTGKTTHLKLWQELCTNHLEIINGDKPIIRFIAGQAYIFGSPWNGKEHFHSNTKSPLTDICFIERSPTNEVVKLDGPEIAQRLSSQMAQSQNPAVIFKNMEFIENLKKQCNFYIIRCNMEIEAAQVAYKAIFGKEYTDG